MASIGGVWAGASVPRWQVQQVITLRPPKFSLLMVFTIAIMRRAIFFFGGVSSSHFGSEVPAPVWQSLLHTAAATEKRPIVPMNSSTGMPFSTWMFLNAWSDNCGLAVVWAN